uniref:GCR041 n=1 Tax=Schmidtea mediterranea TaxID=79327 RepID=A0A193KU80_SCHMD|nr:GCR041 [Schmidtea mediterranea]
MDVNMLDLCKSIYKECTYCIEICLNASLKDTNTPNNMKHETEGSFNCVKNNVNLFIKIFFPIISIVGCIANILIIFVVLRLPSLRRSYTNFFLVNMALADLGVVIWCVNLTTIEYVDAELFWIVGPALCKMNHFLQIMSYTASILLLMLICLERYIAIIFPMKVKNMLSKRIYIVLLIFIWLLSIGFSLPSLFEYELRRIHNVTRCEKTEKISKKTYYISSFVLLYIIPLVLMGSLYGHICLSLVKSLKKITGSKTTKVIKSLNSMNTESFDSQSLQTSSNRNNDKVNFSVKVASKKTITKAANERRRVIIMLIVIVIIFALCRLPRHIWAMMTLHSGRNTYLLLIFPPSAYMFMYLSSAINPLIYFAFSNSFRINLLKALKCFRPRLNKKSTNVLNLSNSKSPKSNTVNI